MKDSIGKRILFSRFSKFCSGVGLAVSIVSLFWDLYKFYFMDLLTSKRIFIDMATVAGLYLLYKIVIRESPTCLSFLRSKIGILISWTLIILYVLYVLSYPVNIILSIILLSFPALHYGIRFLGRKKEESR
jgi:hypothetical protein